MYNIRDKFKILETVIKINVLIKNFLDYVQVSLQMKEFMLSNSETK